MSIASIAGAKLTTKLLSLTHGLRERPALRRRVVRAKQNGGARRDRTDDIVLAKHALSQLSYGPIWVEIEFDKSIAGRQQKRLVGLGRFELPTSRLSSARSNQLSYRPSCADAVWASEAPTH